MTLDNQFAIPRAFERRKVTWEAILQLGDCVMGGVVKDYSHGGAFWSPRVVMVKPLTVGEAGVLTIVHETGRQEKHGNNAEVRWLGHSMTHSCYGIGLRFDTPTQVPS